MKLNDSVPDCLAGQVDTSVNDARIRYERAGVQTFACFD